MLMSEAVSRQIVTTRIFNFPKSQIFEAFSNPEHFQNWWGPNGHTNTFLDFNFIPGGKWNFIMHAPDGENYPNECVFEQIVPDELIAWIHLGHPYNALFTFEEIAPAQTRVTFQMTFSSEEETEKLRPFIAPKNEENFDRLEMEIQKI